MNSSKHGNTLDVAEGEVDGACQHKLGGRLSVCVSERSLAVYAWLVCTKKRGKNRS